MVEPKFKKGDKVNFLYIDDKGRHLFEKNAEISNIEKFITEAGYQYYFVNPHRRIQFVWIDEKNVFPLEQETFAETLYG